MDEKFDTQLVSGRIVKLYHHKDLSLLTVSSDGHILSALIKRGITKNFDDVKSNLKVGNYIRVIGYWKEKRNAEKYQDKELAIVCVDYIATNSLNINQSGLFSHSELSLEEKKKKFHAYLCFEEMCACNLIAKSKMLSTLRTILERDGYMECMTPVMSKNFYAGGAQPFITRMIDGGNDMYLRITSEIALKMIIGGGFNKVFEIGNSFRNGFESPKYITPFVGAEIYTTFIDEDQNIKLSEKIIKTIEKSISPVFESYGVKQRVSFLGDIPRLPFVDYYEKKTGKVFDERAFLSDEKNCQEQCKEVYKYFKNQLIKDQISPIIVTDLPAGNSPLIANKSKKYLYRAYLIANGATIMEIAMGDTNPQNIRDKMAIQFEYKNTFSRDYSNFLHAFDLGMPPIGSIFLGIDRVVPALLGMENINAYLMKL